MSLASVKSRLVLPFWYWLTWVVPDKRPLNWCVCVTSGITDDADTCRSLVSLQRSTVGSEAAGISRRRDRRFLFDRSLRERCAALQTQNKLLE